MSAYDALNSKDDYIIVSDTADYLVQKVVNELIQKGYEPIGQLVTNLLSGSSLHKDPKNPLGASIAVSNSVTKYSQAMIKRPAQNNLTK